MADDLEPTKVNSYGIFGLPSHGPDCRPSFTTFQNESRWAKDSWGTFSLRCAPRSVTTTERRGNVMSHPAGCTGVQRNITRRRLRQSRRVFCKASQLVEASRLSR